MGVRSKSDNILNMSGPDRKESPENDPIVGLQLGDVQCIIIAIHIVQSGSPPSTTVDCRRRARLFNC